MLFFSKNKKNKKNKKEKNKSLNNDSQDGWIQFKSTDELLNTSYRKKLLTLIWQRTNMDRPRFNSLYLKAINNYVDIVQLIPASESHHHSYLGGMIDHGLEVVNYGLKLRQSYLLPIGANAEDIPRQSEAWSAAIMYGALLHDIGKVVVDINVEMNNGQIWTPWSDNLHLPYRFIYKSNRDYSLHPSASALMIQRIIPREGLTWLSKFPDLFPLFLNLCSGHHEKAGILAEIIQKADMSSVSNNLGGDPTKALNKPVVSLMSQMITSIRYLIESELTLNGTQACDGWFDGTDVWLVSKIFTDKMRANLLQNGISGVPSGNTKIFDILKEHNIAIANSENKTIWPCRIESDNGWEAKLSLIRIPANVAFNNVTKAPEPFKGKITVINNVEQPLEMPQKNDNLESDSKSKQINDNLESDSQLEQISNTVGSTDLQNNQSISQNIEDSLYDSVMNLFVSDDNNEKNIVDNMQTSNDNESIDFNSTPTLIIENDVKQKNESMNTANENLTLDDHDHNPDFNSVEPVENDIKYKNENRNMANENSILDDHDHNPFLEWIRIQIYNKNLSINTQTACIHTVEGNIFLVTPKIFQKYSLHIHGNSDDKNWRAIQKEFQQLKIHTKFSEDNYNIWKCLISGKRKKNAVIKGYLIEKKGILSLRDDFPNNPHLTLIRDIEIYKNY